MVFTSSFFLFFFLPILLVVYFLIREEYKNYVLIIFSIFFYAWGEPKFIFIVLLSSGIDYLLGSIIQKYTNNSCRKIALAISVLSNIGILAYFKYAGFFMENVNKILALLHLNSFILNKIILPIGVSFFVFEKITYVVDIYRGNGKPANKFSNYLLYVLFFPKMLAGPIIKYHDIEKQLIMRNGDLELITSGIIRFSVGMAKKVFIADTMGELAETVFSLGGGQLGFTNAWLGIIAYTLQIYFDFSGYSDMAIGLANIFGFRLMENFNLPYISKNFTEFWRRWHISLSTWIKEYLYIPLGGSRVSKPRMYLNLWVCFLLSGLWHGASWTFIIWGAYHGFFMVLDKLFWLKLQKKIPGIINITINMFLIMIGWVIFKSNNITQVGFYIRSLVSPSLGGSFIYLTNNILFFMILGVLFSFVPLSNLYSKLKLKIENLNWQKELKLIIALILFIFSIMKVASVTFNPFLYFRF